MALGLAGCDEVFLDRSPLEDCPADYTRFAGEATRHRVVAVETTWPNAQADCVDDTPHAITHLAVIDSFTEIDSIRTVAPLDLILWVGYARNLTDDPATFFAVTGEPLPSTSAQWAGNEPNNFGGDETTVVLEDRGLNDTPPTRQHAYVCECDGRGSRAFAVAP